MFRRGASSSSSEHGKGLTVSYPLFPLCSYQTRGLLRARSANRQWFTCHKGHNTARKDQQHNCDLGSSYARKSGSGRVKASTRECLSVNSVTAMAALSPGGSNGLLWNCSVSASDHASCTGLKAALQGHLGWEHSGQGWEVGIPYSGGWGGGRGGWTGGQSKTDGLVLPKLWYNQHEHKKQIFCEVET